MISSLIVLALVLGKTDVWTEPATVKVFPDSVAASEAAPAVRIYAARGERETFQICIRAERKAISGVQLRAAALDKQIGAPELRRVAYATVAAASPRRGEARETRWPDPLLDAEPFDVPLHETRALWVTYEIPRDAKPGIHLGELELSFNKSIKQPIPVTIEVFDFELPPSPSLDALFRLDRLAVSDRYDIQGGELERWRPTYDALAPFPLSYSLAANGDLLRVAQNGDAETGPFREHLAYVMEHAPMSAIDLGMGERGVTLFPEPLSKSAPDCLAAYLHGVADWLAERGWLDRACVTLASPAERFQWPDARGALERVQRAEPRVRRVMRSDLHPYWERYTDIWSTPFAHLETSAVQRLRQGISLASTPAIVAEVSTSSAGKSPGSTWGSVPRDAYDGSLYTTWTSAIAPSKNAPEWLRLDFDAPVKLGRVSVVWQPGMESGEIRLETSFDGAQFSTATTRWQGHDAGPSNPAWSEGVLAMEKPSRAVRLTFLATVSGGPVGVKEIIVGAPPENAPTTQIQTPELWMALNPVDFPSLAPDAPAGEVRLMGWVCWANGLNGVQGGWLNHWPRSWDAAFLASNADWDGNERWDGILVYPGAGAPIPSIRLCALRDTVEDHDYVMAAEKAVREGKLSEAAFREACPRVQYTSSPNAVQVGEWTRAAMKARVRIGRALSQSSRGAK